MSAAVTEAPVLRGGVGAPPRVRLAERAVHDAMLRAAAFALLALLAAERFASLELAPPRGRVVACVLIACGCAGVVGLPGRGAAAGAARILAVVLSLYLGLRAAGVPGHLLWPAGWGALGERVGHGLDGLSGWLWPYRGADRWARLDVLMVLPVALVGAAALAAWPGRAPAARRAGALGMLVALYLASVVNASHSGWQTEGLLLFGAIAAWLWLPRLADRRGARAWAWVVAGAALAVPAGALLHGGRPWVNYRAWNPTGTAATSFAWDQDYGPITWSRSNATMLHVFSPLPQLWRVTTLDRFDGHRFLRSAAPPGGYDIGTDRLSSDWFQQATFVIAGLRSSLLPAAGSAVSGGWRTDGSRAITIGPDETVSIAGGVNTGDSYTLSYYAPHPSPARMRSAPRSFPRAYLPYTLVELPGASRASRVAPAALQSPKPGVAAPAGSPEVARVLASPYAPVYRLARALAAGPRTPYDVAARIESFLKSSYAYDEQPPPSPYPLVSFLFTDRRGYCQQFSGAMALMLRMDGIPARVAAGFATGRPDPRSGGYQVRAVDAHSWVEVYFSGLGWVAFDPTPPRTAVHRSSPFEPPAVSDGILSRAAGKGFSLGGHRLDRLGPSGGASRAGGADAGPYLGIAGAVAALIGAVAIGLASRSVRRGLSGDAGGAAEELLAAARALGYPLSSRTTLAQLERRLSVTRAPAVSLYIRMLAARRYASASAAAGPTRGDRRAARRALAEGRGAGAWLTAYLTMPPAL